jgi:hypothetical protein
MIFSSAVYTFTKSPFPIPNALAKDLGRTIEKDDSPTSPWTFLYSLLVLLLLLDWIKSIDYIIYIYYKREHEQNSLNLAHEYLYISSMSKYESLINLCVYDGLLDSKYGLSASDVHKAVKHISTNGKKPWYKTIWRYFDYLYEHKLIEVTKEYAPIEKNKGNDPKDPIYYKLSLNGIFYSILNHIGQFYDGIIIPLLQNYDSNVLFTLFLYPFISHKTLLKINDEIVFSIIYKYLKDVCNTINNFIKSLNSLIYTAGNNEYILNRLFMWPRDSIPLSSPESISFYADDLRNYLKITFNWEWIEKARLIPNYNQNVIDIIKPNEPDEIIRISINEKDNESILRINNTKIDEFVITTHDLFLSIDTKTRERKIDFFVNLIVNKCNEYVPTFLLNLRSQVHPNLQSYELLSKDENFKRALKDMDKISK